MKWSIRIGRIAGIDLYLHATFLILLAWIAVSQYLGKENAASIFSGLIFILVLFAIIILHELGHALAAKRYGIETRDITLLPIGGVARLEKMPEDPRQELVVAFAGPLVNVVIAAAIFIGISISAGPQRVLDASVSGGDFMANLLWVNLWLAFFNLLPAFPMDGGRVLRAMLALKLSRERATEIAVTVGHAMALVFGAIGIFINPFLVFIALFVWVGAEGELQQVRMHSMLAGVQVSRVMATEFETVSADDRLSEVASRIVPGFQSEFPVLGDGRLLGFLGLEDVARGLAEKGEDALAGEYVRKEFMSAGAGESLERVVGEWQPTAGSVLAVLDGETLVGIVTPTNIGEHVMLRSAMLRSRPSHP